jgi:hypothetical protein
MHKKVSNGLFQVLDTDRVIGLKRPALQDTEPDLQLIEKGVHWEATNRRET